MSMLDWPFSQAEFLALGRELDAETTGDEYFIHSGRFLIFKQMTLVLEGHDINVVEWIEGHVPEDLLNTRFIQQLPTWCEQYHIGGSTWELEDIKQAMEYPEKPINPSANEPPGTLSFTLDEFLHNNEAAENEFHALVHPMPAWHALKLKVGGLAGHGPQGENDRLLTELLKYVNENGVVK